MLFLFPVLVAAGGALLVVKAALVFKISRAIQQAPRGSAKVPEDLAAGGNVEQVEYRLQDGMAVRGWYLPSRNGAAILLVHGQPGTRTELLPEAKGLSQHGYGVLLIDLPGHGESDGRATWGENANDALTRGLDYLSQRADVNPERLGALGFSYGASLLARVTTEERRLRAVALTGVYTSARDQLEYGYGKWGALTQWPAVWGAQWDGLVLDDLRPVDVVAKIAPTPILFVAGTTDIVVPYFMSRSVFDRAREPKTFFTVEGAGHGEYASVARSTYFERLTSFFDRTLGESEG